MHWWKKRPLRLVAYPLVAGLLGAFGLWEGVVLVALVALVVELACFP